MVREYGPQDYKTLCHWYESRGLNVPPDDMLPTYGLIAPGVAAGFLIITDCNLAIIDFFISNPESDKESRKLALDQIVEGLLEWGHGLGVTNFKADTQNESIKLRATERGFKCIGEFSNYFLTYLGKDKTWAA
jgi:hypothetical protein